MTLPASGAISLGNLKNEFGGSASPKLSDYYRGGAYNSSFNEEVSTSGLIGLGAFRGLSKPYTAKSNFVTISLTWNYGWSVGYYTGELMIEDGSIPANSVTLQKLANYLSGQPASTNFKLRRVGNYELPTNMSASDPYPVKLGGTGIVFMYLSFYNDGTVYLKPNTERIGTGNFTASVPFLYVDQNGTALYKNILLRNIRA